MRHGSDRLDGALSVPANAAPFWAAVTAGAPRSELEARLARFDARLELHVVPGTLGEPPALVIDPVEASAVANAKRLLKAAPAELSIALSLGKLPRDVDAALAAARLEFDVDFRGAPLRVGFGRGHLLEVSLGVPGGTGDERERDAAELLVREALGFRLFETWVGAVTVFAARRRSSLRVLDSHRRADELTVLELFPTVTAGVTGALRGLPEVPYAHSAPSEDWALLEVEPVAGAADRKDDLFLASSRVPELLKCYLEGSPFSSSRFSRFGERFAHLKYPDIGRAVAERVARRTELERALSSALRGLGAIVGVGLGTASSYIDFALLDVAGGVARVCEAGRRLQLPAESALEFFDCELAEQRISLWAAQELA